MGGDMHDLFGPGRVRGLPLFGLILAVAAVCVLLAAPALAAPTGPTMSLSDLQTAITAAGPGGLDGYFSTVLQGSTITPVAVKIMAVADGQNPDRRLTAHPLPDHRPGRRSTWAAWPRA